MTKSRSGRRNAVFAMAIAAAVWSMSSFAQSTSEAGSATPEKAVEGLGEIVVTANKREERLQDVGITVSALSSESLENRRVENVQDLAKSVPGLEFAPSPNATPVYTLRGVGFFESSIAAYPDVSTYLDQAALPLPAMTTLTAFDLERVEVLKGPQGTLFGNNATGGAINFIAAKPTRDFSAGFEYSYGRFNTNDLAAYVSGPLNDTLRARFALKATHGDDWQYSYTRNDTLGKVDNLAGRLLFDWAPSDRLTANLNLNGWHDRSDTQAPQAFFDNSPTLTGARIQNPVFNLAAAQRGGYTNTQSLFIDYPSAPQDARAADWSPEHRPFGDNSLYQAVLRADYEVVPDVGLTSITNYAGYHRHNATEGDGTALVGLDIYDDSGHVSTFGEELRLANTDKGGRYKWVVGTNYDSTQANEIIDLAYPDASSEHGGNFQGFSRNEYDSHQHMRNIAGFGNLEFNVVDRVKLKGGVRYTSATRDSNNSNHEVPGFVEPNPAVDVNIDNFFNATWPFLISTFPSTCEPNNPNRAALAAAFKPIVGTDSFAMNPATCQAGRYYDSLHEHNVSWSGGVDFKLTDMVLLYANVSKGFKAGSFPTVSAATTNQFKPVTQESLIDYEVGFKTTIPDLNMTFNGAAFYYDYKDKQLRAKIVDQIFGALDALVNVPKAAIAGAELDVTVRPLTGWSVNLAATYLNAWVKEYIGTTGSSGGFGTHMPITANFSGVPLPFAPKIQFALSSDYVTHAFANWDALFGASLTGQSKSIGGLYLSALDKSEYEINSRVLLDLTAGIKSDTNWKFTIWGKNVTNKYYWTNATLVYDNDVRYAGRPAEYGFSIGKQFK
jgi:iron complex outermembrane receptor protein